MAFPCPAADSLAPMDNFLSFDVSLIIPKNIRKLIYVAFSPITAHIRGYSPYSHVHRDVWIIQILLEHSLTWIRLIWLLAFHIPWDRSDSKEVETSIDASCVIEMSQSVYRVFAAFIQPPYAVLLLFEGSWNLSRPFLSYLDFACRPFPVQLLVRAPYDRVLPHYIDFLSTWCWMMGDALIPSFQWILSHWIQIIYSRVGI